MLSGLRTRQMSAVVLSSGAVTLRHVKGADVANWHGSVLSVEDVWLDGDVFDRIYEIDL